MEKKINMASIGIELIADFPIPAGIGKYRVRFDQIKGTRDAFIAKERGIMQKSYPMVFANGSDFGDTILGAMWDSQNPSKAEKKTESK